MFKPPKSLEKREIMTNREFTEALFKKLELVYYWMLAIPLIFLALGFLAIESGQPPKYVLGDEWHTVVFVLLFVFLVIDLFFIWWFYKYLMLQVDPHLSIHEKLEQFRKNSLIVYAAGFFYMLLLTLLYYLFHLEGVLPLYMGLLLYITFRRPTVAKAANDLKLSAEDYHSINYRDIPLNQ
jgi:hypothetical protein